MIPGPVDEDPDRLYVVTGGRSRVEGDRLDTVSLIVAECDPTPGMQSEHAKILQLCRRPMSVVELSAHLKLPVSVVRILLCDLLETGRVAVREPSRVDTVAARPDPEVLRQVLGGLRKL